MFKSTNAGISWTPSNTGLTNTNVQALAIDPQTPNNLYAGTRGGGVFTSADGGATWSAINVGLPETFVSVKTLAVDPQTPTTIYAGTEGGGVFVLRQ